jgi:hypothetical protein
MMVSMKTEIYSIAYKGVDGSDADNIGIFKAYLRRRRTLDLTLSPGRSGPGGSTSVLHWPLRSVKTTQRRSGGCQRCSNAAAKRVLALVM